MNGFEVELNKVQMAGLEKAAGIPGLLKELFTPFSVNYDQLTYELQREFRGGGSPEITHLDLDRITFDKTTGAGKFRVVLDVKYTFGCEDIVKEKEDQTSEWTLKYDYQSGVISFFSSPYIDSRTPADEF